jgi:nucleotide-binding universal stress UspA family protein
MEVAARYGGRVVVFSVYENAPRHAPGVGEIQVEESVRDQYAADMREMALAVIGEEGALAAIEVDSGHAAQAIIQRANNSSVDLIVIGRSGHSGLWGVLLGSTTKRVVDQATCDVLVVR